VKDDLLYVDHMLECIRRSEEYALGGRELFSTSTLVQDGVVRNLQVLAESSKRISSDCQQRHPEIPWRQMAEFRTVAVREWPESSFLPRTSIEQVCPGTPRARYALPQA
jgi:uncharacterized protein with HEPN domain